MPSATILKTHQILSKIFFAEETTESLIEKIHDAFQEDAASATVLVYLKALAAQFPRPTELLELSDYFISDFWSEPGGAVDETKHALALETAKWFSFFVRERIATKLDKSAGADSYSGSALVDSSVGLTIKHPFGEILSFGEWYFSNNFDESRYFERVVIAEKLPYSVFQLLSEDDLDLCAKVAATKTQLNRL